MSLDQLFEQSVEDEFGDRWCLRTSLQDASLVVLRLSTDAFSLNHPGTCVKVKSQFEMENRILQDSGRFNHLVIEARQICQAGHGVDSWVLGDFGFEHAANCNGQVVLLGSRFVPWKFFIQSELPPM